MKLYYNSITITHAQSTILGEREMETFSNQN